MQVGDLVRHNHFGYTGLLIGRDKMFNWVVLRHGLIRLWAVENIEVLNESR